MQRQVVARGAPAGIGRGGPYEDMAWEDVMAVMRTLNALPIPWVDPLDVSNAVLFLASDEARYITGVTLPIDAGAMLK